MEKQEGVYFPSLTGFRGMAAILILLFHSMLPWFKALWIGVPLFFVLSGFLITRILLQNKTEGNYFKAFYIKRALRIFPIYYLAILISIFWGLLVNADLSQLPLFLIYVQNFSISQDIQPDYCYGLMNHTWSLSVEELFYFVWPFIVLISNKKLLIWMTVFISAASIVYKAALITFFYTTHTDQLWMLSLAGNIDGLMVGALLGILSLNPESFINKKFPCKSFLFSALIFASCFGANYFIYLDEKTGSIFKVLLSVSTIVTAFYLMAWLISNSDNRFLILFNLKFLRFTGKISYGIYLYHALVFGILDAIVFHYKINFNEIALFIIKVVLTYFIAIFSWRLIEKPILRFKDKVSYKASS
jgi:peptidoglycan/LPS O-acetylase OafA/YrhL